MRSRRVDVHGGLGALVQAAAIGALARAARPVRHRGVQRLTWTMSRWFDPGNRVTVRIARDTRLHIHLDDGYWTKLLDPGFSYEPEILDMLDRVLTPDTIFLDCGANIGFWSVLMRSRTQRVVAVEASPETYRRLTENLALNGGGVEAVPAALWHEDDARLSIRSHHRLHAGASVCPENRAGGQDGWQSSEVPSVTIDSLLLRWCPGLTGPVVVKLDVEGAEIPAVEGAERTLADRDVIFLFEDHGQDPGCRVSRHLMDLGLVILSPGHPHPLTTAEIRAVKTDPLRGYNFAACWPSAPFVDRMCRSAG